VKYRPGYPVDLVPRIAEITGLKPKHTIADIGSGTGLSALPFLESGNTVIGIEPNDNMRNLGDEFLKTWKNFRSVSGTAEDTHLKAHSVDLILAAQAFHWFDPESARTEFRRILREPGWALLIWNDRQTASSPFLREYEDLLLRHGTDYTTVNHRNIDDGRVAAFFQDAPVSKLELSYRQHVDYDGLKGRLDSSSYIPEPGSAEYERMIAELKELFDRHNKNGFVDIDYTTLVYAGRLL
jgi:ubiquinone/menaquinone biosynthesis C-methylase UbiE